MTPIEKLLSRRPKRARRDGLVRRKFSLTDDTQNRIVRAAHRAGCFTSTVIEALVEEYLPKAHPLPPAERTRMKIWPPPRASMAPRTREKTNDDYGL